MPILDKTYRQILKEEFLSRKEKNTQYSLRSFSKHLGLSPAYVSLVFNEKRHLGQETAVKIARKLNWSQRDQKYFLTLLALENPETSIGQEIALQQLELLSEKDIKFNTLELDNFKMIANWQHGAIATLLTLKKVSFQTSTISKMLNLSVTETELALHRLQRLGLVIKKKNTWSATNEFNKVKSTPLEAIRAYHKQILGLAGTALEKQDFNERDFSNITLTVDMSQMELAKEKIRKFRTEMAQLMEGRHATEVYQLSIQLFRLTNLKEK